jgi:hypothetical protein
MLVADVLFLDQIVFCARAPDSHCLFNQTMTLFEL